MAIVLPYLPRTIEQHKKAQVELERFVKLIKREHKLIVWPQDPAITEVIVRVIPPTWNAVDPYGPTIKPEAVKRKNIPENAFFPVDVFSQIGANKAKAFSTFTMLKSFSGPGQETALAKYEELGGADPIYEAYLRDSRGMSSRDAFNIGPKRQWAAWVIDRRDAPETAMPKIMLLGNKLYQQFLSAAVDEEGNPIPFDAWSADGYDLRVVLKGSFLGGKMVYFPDSIMPVNKVKGRPTIREDRLEAICQYVYANPIPHVLNFLTAEKMTEVVGIDAARGPVNDSDASQATASWGVPEKPGKAGKIEISSFVDDDEESPTPETFKPATAKPKAAAAPVVEEDEDAAPPATTKPTMKAKAKAQTPVVKPTAEDFEDDEETPVVQQKRAMALDDEEEDAPAAVPAKPVAVKASTKAKPTQESFLDDEEEDAPPRVAAAAAPTKKPAKAAAKAKPAASSYDDEE